MTRWRPAYAISGAVVLAGVAWATLGESAARPKDDDRTALETINKRLDKIEDNQRAIMKALDTVLEELRIIKVRATR